MHAPGGKDFLGTIYSLKFPDNMMPTTGIAHIDHTGTLAAI
jgi:hypothetical protein